MQYTANLEILAQFIFCLIKILAHLIFVGRWSDADFIYCEEIFVFLIFVTRANDENILMPKISRSTVVFELCMMNKEERITKSKS